MNNEDSLIDFETVKKEMSRPEEIHSTLDEYEKKMNQLFLDKKYSEALNISIKMLELLNNGVGYEDSSKNVKKHIIRLHNISAVKHLQNGECELAKYFLNICNKFLHKDIETYLITKNNFSCYYSAIGQFRNARNTISDSIKINSLKKINEMMMNTNPIDFDDISVNYANLSALDNSMKSYNDALIDGMHSLVLNQLSSIYNKNSNSSDLNLNTTPGINENTISNKNQNKFVLAYYNIGVQQEFLKRYNDSKVSFKMAKIFSDKYEIDKLLKEKLNNVRFNPDDSKKYMIKLRKINLYLVSKNLY